MKRVGCFVLAFFVLTLLGISAQETYVLKIKVQTANVRSEPDPNSAVVTQLKLGTLLEALQKVGDWYEVTVTDEKGVAVMGYIHANVVDVISGGKKEAVISEKEVKEAVEKQPVRETPLGTAPVVGQAHVASYGGFKILGGIASSNLTYSFEGSEETDKFKKPRMGLQGGLGYEMGGRIGLEMDFLYFQKGAKFEGSESGYNFKVEVNIEEVSVPVLLKLHPLQSRGMFDIFLLGGGEVAYVLSNKVKYNVAGPDLNTSGTEDQIKNTNRMDYGAVFGGGIELYLGGLQLLIEGRYHLGMANLSKADEELGSGSSGKTNALIVMAGFRF